MQTLARTALACFIIGLAAPALAQTSPPSVPSEPGGQNPEEPKKICKKEYITGSRVKKQMVCRTLGFDKDAERAQDNIRKFQNNSGNVVPRPPGAPG